MKRPLLQTAARCWPFTRGKTRFFHDVVLATKLRKKVAGWNNPVKMKRGFDLFCRGDEYLSLWFQLYGDYEPKTLGLLQSQLSREEVFLDVGANLGFFSLSLATHVGCRCHAFEPNPESFRLLRESVSHNGLGGKIVAFQNAVSSEPATLDFVDNPNNAGDSFIETEGTAGKVGNRVVIDAVALDGFAPLGDDLEAGSKRIGAIKMDIQGAEADALRGMEGLIAEHLPLLVVEMDDEHLRNFGSSECALRRQIADLGYRLERSVEGNEIFVPEAGGGTRFHPNTTPKNMTYALTQTTAKEFAGEDVDESVGDPLLAYFGHHKCASTWIGRILWNVCADLGKGCEVYASMQQLREDYPEETPPRDRFYAFMNAEYSDFLKMRPFRGIHVVRDPRDILVSAYFSHKSTHPPGETAEISISEARTALAGKDVGEGLLIEMEGVSRYVFDQMNEWNYSDPAILEIKMEDLSRDPGTYFRQGLRHLGLYRGGGSGILERASHLATMAVNQAAARTGLRAIRLPRRGITDPGLDFILNRLSFERLAGGRRRGEENRTSHYRKGEPGDWMNHFTPKVKQLFKDRYGDLLIRLGYETDRFW